MISRDKLITFINKKIGYDILEKARVKDDMANGVQILGTDEVSVVSLGVSLNEEFLKKAVADKSSFCIFHHGFDFRTYKSQLSVSQQKRLQIIFQNSMTVMGFHYALDAHPTLGNNAQIISKLGAKITGSLFDEWGFAAEFENPIDITILKKKCEALFHRDILHVEGNSKVIQKIGVVSGAAKPHDENIVELHENGIQLYISGETSESRIHVMKEEGIHYFVCGHYSTEIFGVQALGEEIKKEFGDDVVVEFIDVPNPV